jgi:hypothetical protein
MARRAAEDEWDEEEGGDDTVPCPYCRRAIYEDSLRCPHCENYLSEEDAPGGGKPAWLIAGAVVCVAVVLWWVLGGR